MEKDMFSSDVKRMYQIIGILFVIVGMIFSLTGGVGLVRQQVAKGSMCETEAIVTVRYPEGTQVEYMAGGSTYRTILHYSSDFLHVGDSITIYYQPEDPEQVRLGEPVIFYVSLFLGLVLLLIGMTAGYYYTKLKRKRQILVDQGKKVYAQVIRVEYDYRYERDYTYARKLVCQYDTPGEPARIFESEPVWAGDPEQLIGKELAVYIDRRNAANYYVDTSAVAFDHGIRVRL